MSISIMIVRSNTTSTSAKICARTFKQRPNFARTSLKIRGTICYESDYIVLRFRGVA